MRVFLFFGFIALSIVIAFSSITDVYADTQDAPAYLKTQEAAIGKTDTPANVIKKQLKAFRDREAGDAFALTSENFRRQYRDADHFLTMMRFTYQPLTAHLSYSFLDSTTIDGALIQKVEMLNKDGSSVTVLYKLIRDTNGLWVVDGYTILDNDAQPI